MEVNYQEARFLAFFSVLTSVITLYAIFKQIQISEKQNEISSVQNILMTSLQEATFSEELTIIINKISEETNAPSFKHDSIANANPFRFLPLEKDDILEVNPDTLRTKLSPTLAKRIVAFTQNASPYWVSEGSNELSNEKFSPERKKLFKYLVHSYAKLDMLWDSDFSNVRLEKEGFRGIDFAGLTMKESLIRESFFYLTILRGADFSNTILQNVSFSECHMIPCDFFHSTLIDVDFRKSFLPYPIHFKGSDLRDVEFKDAYVPGQDWLYKMDQLMPELNVLEKYRLSDMPIHKLRDYPSNPIDFYKVEKLDSGE